jgi:hypothetical protein
MQNPIYLEFRPLIEGGDPEIILDVMNTKINNKWISEDNSNIFIITKNNTKETTESIYYGMGSFTVVYKIQMIKNNTSIIPDEEIILKVSNNFEIETLICEWKKQKGIFNNYIPEIYAYGYILISGYGIPYYLTKKYKLFTEIIENDINKKMEFGRKLLLLNKLLEQNNYFLSDCKSTNIGYSDDEDIKKLNVVIIDYDNTTLIETKNITTEKTLIEIGTFYPYYISGEKHRGTFNNNKLNKTHVTGFVQILMNLFLIDIRNGNKFLKFLNDLSSHSSHFIEKNILDEYVNYVYRSYTDNKDILLKFIRENKNIIFIRMLNPEIMQIFLDLIINMTLSEFYEEIYNADRIMENYDRLKLLVEQEQRTEQQEIKRSRFEKKYLKYKKKYLNLKISK